VKAHDVSPEDAGALSKVDWQIEQQNLAQVIPHAPVQHQTDEFNKQV